MTKKFLLVNCDPLVTDWLNQRLGFDAHLDRCSGLDELRERLMSDPQQKVVALCGSAKSPREEAAAHPSATVGVGPSSHSNGNGHVSAADVVGKLSDQVDQFERKVIERTLARHGNHRKDTARELGISRVTLYNKMKKFGMLDE